MPSLAEISYSQEACIAAIRDYYFFLTRLYLPEVYLIEPPEGGWPTVNQDILRGQGKSDRVISLLQKLPYIRRDFEGEEPAQGVADGFFADWQLMAGHLSTGTLDDEDVMTHVENVRDEGEQVPAQVVGLSGGEDTNPFFLLDTQLGVIYWLDCPGGYLDSSAKEPIDDNADEYAPESEGWRRSPAWAVHDFFEVLKDLFRRLEWIPVSPRRVLDSKIRYDKNSEGVYDMLRRIYLAHGWPDIERYRKAECLQAVQLALEEHYPLFAEDMQYY